MPVLVVHKVASLVSGDCGSVGVDMQRVLRLLMAVIILGWGLGCADESTVSPLTPSAVSGMRGALDETPTPPPVPLPVADLPTGTHGEIANEMLERILRFVTPSSSPTRLTEGSPLIFTGTVSGNSPVFPDCGGATRTSQLHQDSPCSGVSVTLATRGTVTVTLEWGNPDNDLDLIILRGNTVLDKTLGVRGSREQLSFDGVAGIPYPLIVSYYRGSSAENFTLRATRGEAPAAKPTPTTDPPPPVRTFRVCADMRAAGWTRGVNRNGGTYQPAWDSAESRTYSLNTSRDRDRDGHACE